MGVDSQFQISSSWQGLVVKYLLAKEETLRHWSEQKVEVISAEHPEALNGKQRKGVLITGLSNRRKATHLKRWGQLFYPQGFKIAVRTGKYPRKIKKLPLEHLDAIQDYRGEVRVYFPPTPYRTLPEMEEMMDQLRDDKGCPWDRRQNHQTLKPYLIEEAYEVIDAIERGDERALREELGDLLLQVVFHAQIAKEKGKFHLSDIIEGIITKIIRRHPHVFGEISNSIQEKEVLINWEQIKKREGEKKDLISKCHVYPKETHFPSLLKAWKVQQRASKLGFDWEETAGALDKLKEEIKELEKAYGEGKAEDKEGEMGDVLFSLVNCARFMQVNPEKALKKTVDKFENRFAYIEEQVQASGKNFADYSLDHLENWWQEAKRKPGKEEDKLE